MWVDFNRIRKDLEEVLSNTDMPVDGLLQVLLWKLCLAAQPFPPEQEKWPEEKLKKLLLRDLDQLSIILEDVAMQLSVRWGVPMPDMSRAEELENNTGGRMH